MSKKSMEIGISVGLVFLMIASMMVVQATMPESFHSEGFVITILAFMFLMGLAGFKLIHMKN